MTWKVTVGSGAQRDLSEAAFWYESQRSGLGGRFINELDHLFARMAANPLQFPEIELGVRRGLLRRFPYGAYFIVGPETINVIALLHLHRESEGWRRRI